jgi:hypothetical protein
MNAFTFIGMFAPQIDFLSAIASIITRQAHKLRFGVFMFLFTAVMTVAMAWMAFSCVYRVDHNLWTL